MKGSPDGLHATGVRLDKWLWAARFFKTRSLAQAAIDGGKVYIDGVRAKSSRLVTPGIELQINSPRGLMTVRVEAVSEHRGSGAVAAKLYKESDESISKREQISAMQKLSSSTAPKARPNTQNRRILRRIKEG